MKHQRLPRRTFAHDAVVASNVVAGRGPSKGTLGFSVTKGEPLGPATTASANDVKQLSPSPGIDPQFIENLVAGALGRGIAQTMLHPVDVMRTRLQAVGVTTSFSSIGDVGRTFVKGIAPCVLLSVPAGAIQFVTYEWCKEKLMESNPENPGFAQLMAGAGGALAASSVRVPQEVLKQRVQADVYPNMIACLKAILSTEGPKGLYTGYLSTVLRDVPYNATTFLFFDQFKQSFVKVTGREPENWENLAMGGVAGAVSAFMWTPVDVVKTRLMTQKPGLPRRYNGILGTFTKIYKEEGSSAFMKGVVPRVMYLSPMSAITFSIYEAVKGFMKAQKQKQRDEFDEDLEAYRPRRSRSQRLVAAPPRRSQPALS